MDGNLNPAWTYIPRDQLRRLWKRTQPRLAGESTYDVAYERLPLPFSTFQNHIRKLHHFFLYQSVQLLSHVWLFVTPWTLAHQTSLSITNSRSPLKLMSIVSVIPSNYLILCRPLLLLPPIPPNIRVFSNESILRMRWPKYWSFSFSISPSNEHPGLISLGWTSWISLQSKGLSRVFSNTTLQKHQSFGSRLSSQSNSHIHTWPLEKP